MVSKHFEVVLVAHAHKIGNLAFFHRFELLKRKVLSAVISGFALPVLAEHPVIFFLVAYKVLFYHVYLFYVVHSPFSQVHDYFLFLTIRKATYGIVKHTK